MNLELFRFCPSVKGGKRIKWFNLGIFDCFSQGAEGFYDRKLAAAFLKIKGYRNKNVTIP